MKLLHGDIVYSGSDRGLCVHENSYIAVDKGRVEGIYPVLPECYKGAELHDYGRGLIIPALSDLHLHAPQYAQRGTGMDLLLPDWLSRVTFPEEAKFRDHDYAKTIYTLLADELIRNGSFHVSVYATLHTDTALLLADILESRGISGFVGKVNMDRNSPEYLTESTEQSLRETERFLAAFTPSRRLQPILTPRFAPTCSRELIESLGRLGKKYGVGMQTHVVESLWEKKTSTELFPECRCDSEIYKNAGLLENSPCLFGHFIFPSEEDIQIAEEFGAVAVHCPDATNNIIAGIAPMGALLDSGIRSALGTDIGAGHSTAVYREAGAAVRLSKLKELYEGDNNRAISFTEAFYMATRGGGEVFGRVGAFEKGYSFDALVLSGLEDVENSLSAEKRLERFCYAGDDRNILARYIFGKKL